MSCVAALDLVSSMAAKPAKKGSSKPVIEAPELSEVIDTFIVRKQEAETAQALCDAAKEQIVSFVRPKRLELCVRHGKVLASVSLNNKITFTQTCRYSKVPEARQEAIAEAFGEDTDRYFKTTLSLGLKSDSANDEAVLTKLVESLGTEFFSTHFEVSRDLLVQDAFHNDYCTRKEVQERAEEFIEEETIRPYSPSLKVA